MKISRHKKRTQRHQRRMRHRSTLNMVSLMDIFTILVFFLLVNHSEIVELDNSTAIKLPESIAEQQPKDTLVIAVNGHSILFHGRKIAATDQVLGDTNPIIPSLKKVLAAETSQGLPTSTHVEKKGLPITILGDRDIPYHLLKKIMMTCAQANYTHISLAVTQKLQQEG